MLTYHYCHFSVFVIVEFVAHECMWFVTVRQTSVYGHTMKFGSICWRKEHASVVCSVRWSSTRHLCLMYDKSSQSTCLQMIFMLPRTDQTASVITDGKLLQWRHFNSRLVFGLQNLKWRQYAGCHSQCRRQQKLPVNDSTVVSQIFCVNAVVQDLHSSLYCNISSVSSQSPWSCQYV